MHKQQQGFSAVEGLLAALVIVVIAFGGYYVWSQNTGDTDSSAKSTNGNTVNQTDTTSSNNSEEQGAKKVLSFSADKTSVELSYPDSWQVKEYVTEDSTQGYQKGVYLVSNSGNYLHLFEPSGIGGACEPDSITYTLDRKINTQTENVYFTQYSSDIDSLDTTYMRVEDLRTLDSQSETHLQMKEGESNSGYCQNMVGYYSTVGDVYIVLKQDAVPGLSSTITADMLKNDPALEAVLQSLEVIKG